VATTGTPIFSVDYRLAPEHPHPTLVEDTYASLVWLTEHVKDFNVDRKRVAITGESAGGGIAAGVGVMARDRKLHPPLAK
jgi:acetyl esterase/lipase